MTEFTLQPSPKVVTGLEQVPAKNSEKQLSLSLGHQVDQAEKETKVFDLGGDQFGLSTDGNWPMPAAKIVYRLPSIWQRIKQAVARGLRV